MYGCCISRELTKAEKVEMLSDYKEALEKGLEGVNERLKELEK